MVFSGKNQVFVLFDGYSFHSRSRYSFFCVHSPSRSHLFCLLHHESCRRRGVVALLNAPLRPLHTSFILILFFHFFSCTAFCTRASYAIYYHGLNDPRTSFVINRQFWNLFARFLFDSPSTVPFSSLACCSFMSCHVCF